MKSHKEGGSKLAGKKGQFSTGIFKFFLIGLILALESISINIAYTMQIVPYVISLKRLSILFSVVYGGLIFKEENMIIRCLGAFIMTTGVVLIILCNGYV